MSPQETFAESHAKAAKKIATELAKARKIATDTNKNGIADMMASAHVEISELKAAYQTIIEENQTIRRDKEELKAENQYLDKKYVASLKERDGHVKNEDEGIKDEPDSAKERGDALEAENGALKEALASVTKECDAVTKERDDGKEKIDDLQDQLDTQRKIVDLLSKRKPSGKDRIKVEPFSEGTGEAEAGVGATDGTGASVDGQRTKRKAGEMDGDSDLEKRTVL